MPPHKKSKKPFYYLVKVITSFFYIGYLPLIPGTFGSLAALVIFYFFKGNILLQFVFFLAVLVLGLFLCGIEERYSSKKDPGHIVIDEVCGMFLSLLFLPYYDIRVFFCSFLLFRVTDTLKPYPAGRIQNLHSAVGIMGDDIIAGLYTNIVLQVVLRLVALTFS